MTEIIDQITKALTGRYEIERELGAGGMATVYLVRDNMHDRNLRDRPIVLVENFLEELESQRGGS